MATLSESRSRDLVARFDSQIVRQFVRDNITRSKLLTIWLILFAGITASYVSGQLAQAPVVTGVVLALWLAGLTLTVVNEARHQHNSLSRWLKHGLFSSITNSLLTLLLVLLLLALLRGLWGWAVVRATFSPDVTAPDLRSKEGANWGVVWGARKLLLTGTLDTTVNGWRVWLSLAFVVVAGVASFFAFRPPLRDRVKGLRRLLTVAWLLSPIILFVFLRGAPTVSLGRAAVLEVLVLLSYAVLYFFRVVRFSWRSLAGWVLAWPILYGVLQALAASGIFPAIAVDTWGGLLFTLIVSVFAIVVSFPLGLVLALGRRSEVQGIPGWLYWPAGVGVTIYLLATSTPGLLESARGTGEQILSYWPLLILLATYGFHRLFRGNMVAAASTVYIEVVRGVPLITVLFMAVIMAKFFFPPDAEPPANAWSVMVGFALFTAAYLAENVRGGLQSIPRGQYEAADAIGLNTLQKMRFIILPQALRAVIPAIVGLFIGVFKDSSLVAIVGLFDLLGIINAIISNPAWLGLRRELYVFVAIVYFIGSFAMSSYSRRLEKRLGLGER